MENKAFLRLMLLFLGFSFLLLCCAAVSTTRSLKSNKEVLSFSAQDLLAQKTWNVKKAMTTQESCQAEDAMKLSEAKELFGEEDAFSEGRMLMESTDYPGTGANKNHDPTKPPGRA